jgi:hypothetical protein
MVRYFRRYASEHEPQAAEQYHARLPDETDVQGIIDSAFWASLRREEGYQPRISLAFLRPEHTSSPLTFERSIPLGAAALAKLAPAVERPGIHLGVWRNGGVLSVWGTTRDIPNYCFVLEVVDPGLLVVKHRRTDAGKFVNVLVLQGDQIKLVDERASTMPDCPSVLKSLLGLQIRSTPFRRTDRLNTRDEEDEDIDVLVELAVSMRAHKRGGSLLVVPAGSETWRESILEPAGYAVSPPFPELAALMGEPDDRRHARDWQEALHRSVEAVAGLTAVDGATLITDRYELLAFGAKIGRRAGGTNVEEIIATEPIEGSTPTTVHPAELGGTRHLSAAQFVQDQRDALALVASQDGRFTVFAWSGCENLVHAHRVESLLL